MFTVLPLLPANLRNCDGSTRYSGTSIKRVKEGLINLLYLITVRYKSE